MKKQYVRTTSIKYIDSEEPPATIESLIKNPKIELKDEVRFAVYDSLGNFLGYKVDSFWSLDKKCFKDHDLTRELIDTHFIKNLMFLFNDMIDFKFKGKFDTKRLLYIVAEDILLEEGLAGICISKNKDGKYSAK